MITLQLFLNHCTALHYCINHLNCIFFARSSTQRLKVTKQLSSSHTTFPWAWICWAWWVFISSQSRTVEHASGKLQLPVCCELHGGSEPHGGSVHWAKKKPQSFSVTHSEDRLNFLHIVGLTYYIKFWKLLVSYQYWPLVSTERELLSSNVRFCAGRGICAACISVCVYCSVWHRRVSAQS